MQKIFLNIVFTLSAFILFSQDDTLNFRDSENRKQGYWIFYGKDRPESGIPANGKAEEGRYVNDRKEGPWIKYHDDGITPRIKGCYRNNRPCGEYMKFGLWGGLSETGTFEKNIQLDSLKRWYDNGNLQYEAWYNKRGKEEGTVNYYYPSGQLEYTFCVDSLSKEYSATRFYYNGNLKEIISYDNKGNICKVQDFERRSQPIEEWQVYPNKLVLAPTPGCAGTYFNPNGYNKVYTEGRKLLYDGIFSNGILVKGRIYEYDEAGKLLRFRIIQ